MLNLNTPISRNTTPIEPVWKVSHTCFLSLVLHNVTHGNTLAISRVPVCASLVHMSTNSCLPGFDLRQVWFGHHLPAPLSKGTKISWSNSAPVSPKPFTSYCNCSVMSILYCSCVHIVVNVLLQEDKRMLTV